MKARPETAATLTWIALVALTFLSLGLVTGAGPGAWTALTVAAIAWIKGTMVAKHFMETGRAGRLFARVVRIFVALAPVALMLTALIEHGPWR